MSLLDYVENPQYGIVAVAHGPDDAVVLISIPKAKAILAIETTIALLTNELEGLRNTAALIPNNPPGVSNAKHNPS